MRTPIISVITIVFNGAHEIERTIESVVKQTYKNIEYILVDGGSKDTTMHVVEQYRTYFTTIVSEPDGGIYDAMNKGLRLATGDYVCFVNCGDMLASHDVLEKVINAIMLKSPWPDLVYGAYQEYVDGQAGAIIPSRSHRFAWYGMFASHQSTFCKRSIIKEHRLCFDLSYRIAADYKFLLCMVKYSLSFLQLPISISCFDVSGVSCSNQDEGLAEADRARKEVLGMGWASRTCVIMVSRLARFAKQNLTPVYKLIRNR